MNINTAGRIVSPTSFPCYVSVKATQRSYGGPQEGGWYYDSFARYTGAVLVRNEREYQACAKTLVDEFRLSAGFEAKRMPSRWSGRECCQYQLWTSNAAPTDGPLPRPQWE